MSKNGDKNTLQADDRADSSESTEKGCSLLVEYAKRARTLWLAPHPDLRQVESLYRQALQPVSTLLLQQQPSASSATVATTNPWLKKKRTRNGNHHKDKVVIRLTEEQQLAVEKLCMLLCQSGRALEAKEWLEPLGFTCRLASCVLDYPAPTAGTASPTQNEDKHKSKRTPQPPCCIYDRFLSARELHHLREVFLDPNTSYWVDHNYQVEPPSPYFSYIIPLLEREPPWNAKENDSTDGIVSDTYGFLGRIISKIYHLLINHFPQLATATAVEMWAHNRPHPTGHQLHFDSDNEGLCGVIRNPIISSILYLSSDSSVGGPSMIARQTLTSRHLANKAWLSDANQAGRLLAFDGRVLHGVLPGKGTHNGSRRVTLMLAFWNRIRVRPGGQPGAARPFPGIEEPLEATLDAENNQEDSTAASKTTTDNIHPLWCRLLIEPQNKSEGLDPCASTATNNKGCGPVEQAPIVLNHVYETLDGEPWTKAMGFPEYDQVFQGF